MKSIVILTSLYDDWESAAELFCSFGDELRRRECPAQLVIINDASIEPCPAGFLDKHPGFSSVEVITLNRNVGSQRALAVGLAHVFEHKTAAGVVIMDADGEDRPADLMLLIEAFAAQTTPQVISPRAPSGPKAGCSRSAIDSIACCTIFSRATKSGTGISVLCRGSCSGGWWSIPISGSTSRRR